MTQWRNELESMNGKRIPDKPNSKRDTWFCFHKYIKFHPVHTYEGFSELMTNIELKACVKCGKRK